MSEETQIRERYDLSIERIRAILFEETVSPVYRDYFRKVANFILQVDSILNRVQSKGTEECTIEELQKENADIYSDILKENYTESYANPTYAVSVLGEEIGKLLSFLYTEIRGEIAYAYENRRSYLAICNELFIEIYNCFENEELPSYRELKDIIYWYVSDYSDVFVADRIEEKLNPECSFATDIVMNSDLEDLRYLYKYGEYITENEWKTAEYLNSLSQEMIDKMAERYVKEYCRSCVDEGIVLSEKSTVNIQYAIGFERVIRKVIGNLEKMGLRPTIYRVAGSTLTKNPYEKCGFYATSANKQYEYDHRNDQGFFLNKKMVERKLDVMKNAYEQHKVLAEKFAGSVVIINQKEETDAPLQNEASITLTEKQEQLLDLYNSKSVLLVNQYMQSNKYLLREVNSVMVDIQNGDL